MATITAMVGGGNWSSPGTWSGGAVPTAADDVILANVSGNVTIDVNSVCRSLDCQASGNYAGTLSHAAGVYLTIGDATAGAGNRILRLSPSMTVSSNGGAWNLNSTSATQQTVTSAGKSINWLTITGGASSSYLLADALTVTVSLVHNIGTFNTGNQSVTCASFVSSNSNTRTLTLGSSTITCTGTSGWDCANTTNMTVTASTASIRITNISCNFNGGNTGIAWPNVYLDACQQGSWLSSLAGSVASLTVTGNTTKTCALTFTTGLTVTGTLTVNGNSATSRMLLQSNTLGTARTITAAAVSLTNVDFMDITGAGAASWTGTSLGDCGGNTGITFTASVTRYGVVAGNWSSTATWSATSGGAGGASVPLPQDDVILDASSAAGTYTIDMPRACRNLTCTAFTRTLNAGTNNWAFYGSLTYSSGMTIAGTTYLVFASGRGSHTITSAGKAWGQGLLIAAPGGTYSLADALTVANALYVQAGTFVSSPYSVTAPLFSSNYPTSNAVTGASSTWSLTGTGTVWQTGTTTINSAPATIALTDTSATTKTFAGGGKVYNVLSILGGASNSIAITGANTFDRITIPAGCVLTLPSSTTTTFTGAGIISGGTAASFGVLQSSSAGTAANVSKASGVVETDYLTLKDSAATGGATWNAGVHSVAQTGVTGWNMTGTISKYAYCPVAAVPSGPIAKTASIAARVPAATHTRGPIAKTANVTATVPAATVPSGRNAKTANIAARAHTATGTAAAPNKTVSLTARTPVGVTVTAATYGPTVGCITLNVSAACPGPLRVRGSAMTITATVQRAGHLFDPEDLVLNVRKPDGTRLALPKTSAGRESSGVYTWEIELDQAGNWIAEAVASGHVEAATDLPAFHVAAAGLS